MPPTRTTPPIRPPPSPRADLQSCIALLAASQLSLDADSIEPDVREETLALSDEITETEPSTLQAVVNAAVYKAPADQTVKVDVPAGNYTGTLVIPDATIVVKDASGKETNINYTNKNIILNMTGSTLTVPTDAAVGVSVFGSLTIQGGTSRRPTAALPPAACRYSWAAPSRWMARPSATLPTQAPARVCT